MLMRRFGSGVFSGHGTIGRVRLCRIQFSLNAMYVVGAAPENAIFASGYAHSPAALRIN